MALFNREQLEELIHGCQSPCISVFIPTEPGVGGEKNKIQFKNQLQEAEKQLENYGLEGEKPREFLAEAYTLLESSAFWANQRQGFAAFISRNSFYYYRVPVSLEARVFVGEQFYLRPLLPLIVEDGRFFLLAISQNQLRLFEGTRDYLNELDLEDVPRSMREALPAEELPDQMQHHGGGGGHAIFHGHGATGKEHEKKDILRYFHRVDEGLRGIISDKQRPLVLAGVQYEREIFEQATDYPNVLSDGVEGSPDRLGVNELHQRAWQVVQPYFAECEQEAREQYNELKTTERTSDDLRNVLIAAHQGRVLYLFVNKEATRWGSFDEESGEVYVHEEPVFSDSELLNVAAVHTHLNQGNVFEVPPQEMPDSGKPVNAVFRY